MDLLQEARRLVEDVKELSRLDGRVYRHAAGRRGILIAVGKGAVQMAEGFLKASMPEGGVVIAPRGAGKRLEGLELIEAAHPLPDENSLRAGEAALEWARAARGGSLTVLVSGGASALMEKPLHPLTLEELREVNRILLASGATIQEINAVRKHLSAVKGGRLAREAMPASVLGLYASDVPGDNIDAIGSGPTAPDPTTYAEAERVLIKYGIADQMPRRALEVLREGIAGQREETPKPGDPLFSKVENRLIATNMDVLRGLRERIEARGFRSLILTSRLEGEAKEVGRALASITLEALERGVPISSPGAILAGGETVVRVRSDGKGGRNMELALAWAISMRRWGAGDRAVILSMDTDGIDGNTEAAGAILTGAMIERAIGMGIDPTKELESNNSYRVVEAVGGLVITGPTGSNLNSLQVILF